MGCFAKGDCPGFSVISLGSHSGMAGTGKTTEIPAVPFSAYKRISLITRLGSAPRERARRASLVSWSSACSSNAAAIVLAILTISNARSGGNTT